MICIIYFTVIKIDVSCQNNTLLGLIHGLVPRDFIIIIFPENFFNELHDFIDNNPHIISYPNTPD